MKEEFNYSVVIRGIDGVPLRTNSSGARALMKSFHDEPQMENLLLEAVNSGKPFKNPLITVTRIDEKPQKLMSDTAFASMVFGKSTISTTKTAKKKTAKKSSSAAVKKPTKKKASRYS